MVAIPASSLSNPNPNLDSTSSTKNLHLKGIKYVIFPEQRIAQLWDSLMILVIIFYAFYIPFHGGISEGYLTYNNLRFFCFVVSMNAVFVVDTFMVFFRAFHDDNGMLVFSLRTIARKYIRSGWFFINLLACFPTTTVLWVEYHKTDNPDEVSALFIMELFKLLRLVRLNVRIKTLLQTSQMIKRIYEHVLPSFALTVKFLFLIILVAHWFGCIWGLVAYIENGHTWTNLQSTTNWISYWYGSGGPVGSLDPIGSSNFMNRYWLCVFWSLQTITSVGYGNVVPVTAAEYVVANTLMICSGIFWAYVIGSLVDVVANSSKLQNEYVSRMDKANRMIKNFVDSDDLSSSGTESSVEWDASKRVRRFLTNQRDHCNKNWLDEGNSLTLSEAYPTLDILSPELRNVCALRLMRNFLDTIPYLSSRYLSPDEQAAVALQCRVLEFSAGERFSSHPEFGRGILIFTQGLAFTSRTLSKKNFWTKGLKGHALDMNEVLVEDEYYKEKQLFYYFVSYTKVFFLPRLAIMNILERNPVAWKECARWRYFGAALVLDSLKNAESLLAAV